MFKLDPIVIVGVGSSGTSIFTKVLQDSGVFIGGRDILSHRHMESRFWVYEINVHILKGDWGYFPPQEIDHLMNKVKYINEKEFDIVKAAYNNYVSAGYTGEGLWGFKDPRTCITIHCMHYLFPKMKVIHIIRDGRDVALSLQKAHGKTYDHWMNVWEAHARRVTEFCNEKLNKDSFIEVRFENLCRDVKSAKPIFNFLGIEGVGEEYLKNAFDEDKIGKHKKLLVDTINKMNKNSLLKELGYV